MRAEHGRAPRYVHKKKEEKKKKKKLKERGTKGRSIIRIYTRRAVSRRYRDERIGDLISRAVVQKMIPVAITKRTASSLRRECCASRYKRPSAFFYLLPSPPSPFPPFLLLFSEPRNNRPLLPARSAFRPGTPRVDFPLDGPRRILRLD